MISKQCKQILKHMATAGDITAREAMADYSMTSATLSRRVCDLIEKGFDVARCGRVHPITGKRYTAYKLRKRLTGEQLRSIQR